MAKKTGKNYPPNHGKHFSKVERQTLRFWASLCMTKKDMYNQAALWANQLGRTIVSICKQIEKIKKQQGQKEFFWAMR